MVARPPTPSTTATGADVDATRERARADLPEALGRVLADTFGLYLQTHRYHWNVTGAQSRTLHLMFEDQYRELWEAVDAIAERMRELGLVPPASYAEFTRLTALPEDADAPDSGAMVDRLRAGHGIVARTACHALALADWAGDRVTADSADAPRRRARHRGVDAREHAHGLTALAVGSRTAPDGTAAHPAVASLHVRRCPVRVVRRACGARRQLFSCVRVLAVLLTGRPGRIFFVPGTGRPPLGVSGPGRLRYHPQRPQPASTSGGGAGVACARRRIAPHPQGRVEKENAPWCSRQCEDAGCASARLASSARCCSAPR